MSDPLIGTVFYGGELSESIANRIVEAAIALSPPVILVAKSMASYKKKDLEALVAEDKAVGIFILQTVENDQPPEDSGAFVRYFKRKTHAADLLKGKMRFTVLACGDSNLLLDRQTTTAKDCNKCGQVRVCATSVVD